MVIQLPPEIEANPKYAQLVAACSEVYVLPSELAERWRVTVLHLGNLRRARRGPPWVKFETGRKGGGAVRYRLCDILEFELRGYDGSITAERIKFACATLPEFSNTECGMIAAHLVARLFPKE